MANLQEPLLIRGNRIKNRIVMAPMVPFSFRGDNGSHYGTQHIAHYTERAKGGAGLIEIQATHVLGAADGTGQWSADNVRALRQIAQNGHDENALLVMQVHCDDLDINKLTAEQIHSMQLDMTQAAVSVCNMGYDGVEYHFAHGFTLCKFLDAAYNKRTDAYGGDTEGRTRILTEILPDIRSKTHSKFIIGVRMGEYIPTSQDGIAAAKAFEKAGIDLLSISFGMQPPKGAVPQGFPCSPVTYSGCKIRAEVDIPVIAVNEIRSEAQVRFLIEQDAVELVAVGRAMFADPAFANHVINSEPVNKCYGCARCHWFSDHTKCPAYKKLHKNQ